MRGGGGDKGDSFISQTFNNQVIEIIKKLFKSKGGSARRVKAFFKSAKWRQRVKKNKSAFAFACSVVVNI